MQAREQEPAANLVRLPLLVTVRHSSFLDLWSTQRQLAENAL